MATTAVDELEDLADEVLDNNEKEDTPEDATSPTPIDDEEDEGEDEEEGEDGEEGEEGEEGDDDNIGKTKNPVIHIFGLEIDQDSMVVGLLIIVIWIMIWFSSGLSKTLDKDITFTIIFLLLIAYTLVNIVTAGSSSGGVVYELNILLTVEQMIAILFGTIVLFALFNGNIPVHENCKRVIVQLSISIVIVLTIASLWVNIKSTGRSFRAIRKFKQGIYNVALTIFIIIGLIYVKGTKCPKPPSNNLE